MSKKSILGRLLVQSAHLATGPTWQRTYTAWQDELPTAYPQFVDKYPPLSG